MESYEAFLAKKEAVIRAAGFEQVPPLLPALFPFQRDIVAWALRRGRAAVFAGCGLGKTVVQLEWARHVAERLRGRVLIFAPLAVAQQTVAEGRRFGIRVEYATDQGAAPEDAPIVITNYERLDRFDPAAYVGVVIDESSILKNLDGKTRTALIDAFEETPYRLACTATPAPNDFLELGNHAEFLGVLTYAEMCSRYFVHDGGSTQDWRLKGHAADAFWRWVCSWAVTVQKPSDLGYPDGDFILPPLTVAEHVVPVDHKEAHASGMLFKLEALTLDEQRAARRGTIEARVAKAAWLARHSVWPWLIWCELNAEGDALERAIPGSVQIAGRDSIEVKTRRLLDFAEGRARVLITKPKVAGFGMNFQHCANVAFVGISHSFEQTYQAVRRCWRFGQKKPVTAHLILAETEGRVAANLRRKERDAERLMTEMIARMHDVQSEEIRATTRTFTPYRPELPVQIPAWLDAYAKECVR